MNARRAVFLMVVLQALFAGCAAADSIITSRHNLSLSGTGQVRSTTQSEICIFWHPPHSARAELG
jgi:hypothetical protein